jgi:hypothetical protein
MKGSHHTINPSSRHFHPLINGVDEHGRVVCFNKVKIGIMPPDFRKREKISKVFSPESVGPGAEVKAFNCFLKLL